MRTLLGSLVLVAACWSAKKTPVSEPPQQDPPPAKAVPLPTTERRGVLRIDQEPAARKFQGVWLEIGDRKWVVDYRARQLWKWFVDREVIVTGSCYEPVGAAIGGTHFRVDTLKISDNRRGRGPYFGFGPEQVMTGKIQDEKAPAGSKAAGTSKRVFVVDGKSYDLKGEENFPDGETRVRARVLEPDLSFVARSGDADVWIVDLAADNPTVPREIPCPAQDKERDD